MLRNTYYYVHGHTASGMQDFLQSNIMNIDNVLVLNHPSLKVKTAVIRQIINLYEDRSNLEIIKSPHGDDYLDGVIARNPNEPSVAVITESEFESDHMVKVNLEQFFKVKSIDLKILDEENLSVESAYDNFSTGLNIHDKLEKLYIDQMDFVRADQLAEDLIEKLLGSQPKLERKGHVYHRLFGTNTSDGVVNVVPSLLEDISNCYFIKGRAGTGKSTFMKKIANACTEHGLDIELYHCSFDPSGIDMVIARDLDFCIFDSTDPHEFFPKKNSDHIIDLYKETVAAGTDEKFADEINELNSNYKSYMKKGIGNLKEAGFYRDQMENKYELPDEKELEKVVDKNIRVM